MRMPTGNGQPKSTHRNLVERELDQHSKHGASLTPQRIASATGVDLELVRKVLSNMRRHSLIINTGSQGKPAYRKREQGQADSTNAAAQNARSIYQRGNYDGEDLRPFDGRPGAMDAFGLPSVVGGRALPPRRITAMCVGVK